MTAVGGSKWNTLKMAVTTFIFGLASIKVKETFCSIVGSAMVFM